MTWANRVPAPDIYASALTYYDGQFVAVGLFGAVVTSTNAIDWIPVNSGTTNSLSTVVFGGGAYVAGGAVLLHSADAKVWVNLSSGNTADLNAVAYGNGRFVAAGAGGSILSSADALQWIASQSGTNDLYAVAYANGLFVSVGASGTIETSPDAKTWVGRASGITDNLLSVAFGGGTFLAVGEGGTILASTNGVDWAQRDSGVSGALEAVAYNGGAWVAAASDGTVLTSQDGSFGMPRVLAPRTGFQASLRETECSSPPDQRPSSFPVMVRIGDPYLRMAPGHCACRLWPRHVRCLGRSWLSLDLDQRVRLGSA